MKTKPLRIILLLFPLILVLLYSPHSNIEASSSNKVPSVTMDDLRQAGYGNISVQEAQQDGKYRLPNLYFWVNGQSTTDLHNLFAISIYDNGSPYTSKLFDYGINIHPISIRGGQGQEGQLINDTRVALNFAKGNFYIVLIGPDSQKVESLANIIAGKIN